MRDSDNAVNEPESDWTNQIQSKNKGRSKADIQSDAKWTQCLCINILDLRAFASEWSNFLDLLCYSRSVRQEAVEEEEEEEEEEE